MKNISFQNQLCTICLQSFSPFRLKKIGSQSICPECFHRLKLRNKELVPLAEHPDQIVSENYEESQEKNIINAVKIDGKELLSNLKGLTPFLITLILLRVVAYLGSSFYLNQESSAYAILSGVMLGDFSTWLLFSIIQLPFAGQAVAHEFVIYGGITAYLGGTGKIVLLAPPTGEAIGIACLAFILTGFIKTTVWALKTFDLIYS
jgi:hypothetical protein